MWKLRHLLVYVTDVGDEGGTKRVKLIVSTNIKIQDLRIDTLCRLGSTYRHFGETPPFSVSSSQRRVKQINS